MTERQWLPHEWQDEMPPTPQTHPNDFLRKDDAGYYLAPVEWAPVPGELEEYDPRIRLADQQSVSFTWVEHYGFRTLTVAPDGTWSLDEPFPESAKQFWLPADLDTLCFSIEDLVSGNVAGEDFTVDPLDAGEHLIAAYTWGAPAIWLFDEAGGTLVEGASIQ